MNHIIQIIFALALLASGRYIIPSTRMVLKHSRAADRALDDAYQEAERDIIRDLDLDFPWCSTCQSRHEQDNSTWRPCVQKQLLIATASHPTLPTEQTQHAILPPIPHSEQQHTGDRDSRPEVHPAYQALQAEFDPTPQEYTDIAAQNEQIANEELWHQMAIYLEQQSQQYTEQPQEQAEDTQTFAQIVRADCQCSAQDRCVLDPECPFYTECSHTTLEQRANRPSDWLHTRQQEHHTELARLDTDNSLWALGREQRIEELTQQFLQEQQELVPA